MQLVQDPESSWHSNVDGSLAENPNWAPLEVETLAGSDPIDTGDAGGDMTAEPRLL